MNIDAKSRQPACWQLLAHGRESYEPGQRYWWDNARRPDAGLWVIQSVTQGEIVFRQAGQTEQRIAAGQLVVFRHGEPSAYGQPEPLHATMACQWVQLRGAGLSAHLEELRREHGPVVRPRHLAPALDAMDRLTNLGSSLSQATATRIADAAYGLVTTLYDLANDDAHLPRSRVELALQDLLTFPCRSRTLDQVAQQYRISREHLSRSFRQRTGQTVRQYLAQARVTHALTLLRETGLPLAEVALQSGLDHPNRLAQHVRRQIGQSPTAFRQSTQTKKIAKPFPPRKK